MKMERLLIIILLGFSMQLRSQENCNEIYHNPLFVNKQVDIGGINVFYADDGFYYLYGSGEYSKQVLYRSKNLVDWENTHIVPIPEKVQREIQNMEQPSKLVPGKEKFKSTTRFWAPMIAKVGSNYNLYTSVGAYSGIICLQSQSPLGPFTFQHYDRKGKPKKLIDLKDVGIPYDVIDACYVYDHTDGRNYLFFGSNFGVYRVELSKDGTELATSHYFELIAGCQSGGGVSGGYEGTMVYFYQGYWYLILSPRGNYKLLCWRCRDLKGPFLDEKGNSPMSDKYGHEILKPQEDSFKTPEGYSLRRTGHSGEIFMDKSGRYFIFCEASVEPLKNPWWRKAPCLTEIKWDKEGWPSAITKDRRVAYENVRPNM